MKRIVIIFTCPLLILALRFYFFYSNHAQLVDGQQVSFETTILSQPQLVGNQQRTTANYKNQSFGKLRIKITASRFPELNYGDFVRISGPIRVLPRAGDLQSRAREGQPNGIGTSLSQTLIGSNITMYFPKIETINNSSNILRSGLKSVNILRQKLISLFSKTLPSPSSSLLLGIIFGIKEQMPKDFADNLKAVGVFHVIAASGMNVTLIGGFISFGFALFLKRQIAIGLSILGIMFYAVMAGLEPSIIRASIMGILVFSAQIMGRQALAVNGLVLAGFGMLFIDPTLISDIGFQLSFAATAGILYMKNLPSTIAAQIATLPILLANFGTYSIYSILVNGLVLWAVPMLMMIGGLGAVLGLILEPLGQLLIYLCYPLLLYFETIVNFFGKIGGVLIIKTFSWQFTVGYYCLLISVLLILKRKA